MATLLAEGQRASKSRPGVTHTVSVWMLANGTVTTTCTCEYSEFRHRRRDRCTHRADAERELVRQGFAEDPVTGFLFWPEADAEGTVGVP